MEFGEFFNYQLHAFKKKYRTLNSGYSQWKFKQQRQNQNSYSELSLSAKDQVPQEEDSEGRDSYDYELYEEQMYNQHQKEVERNIRLKNEMEEIVAEKKSEAQEQIDVLDKQLKKDLYKGQDDPCGIIRNQDLEERIGKRGDDEMKFDILLSGTSATLVI